MTTTTIPVRGIKVSTLIPPASLLAAGLVPPEPQPAGNPVICLELEGGSLSVRVVLNGKSVRKAIKAIAEHGTDGVNVVLQGNLRPSDAGGWYFELDAAGLAVTPKVAREPKGEAAA